MNDQFDIVFNENSKVKTIGVIVVSMDRTDNLKKCVQSCLNNPQIHEIVVLDYGSKNPIKSLFDNPKIKNYRIDAQFWHLTKAYNIAAQLSSCDIIIKLDADYVLDETFISKNYIYNNEYITGFNIKDSLCGFLMIHKVDFIRINGYNERIISYGYDDDDINYRLSKSGLFKKQLDRSCIKHLWHNKTSNIWFANGIEQSVSREDSIYKNHLISQQKPWTKDDKMSKYKPKTSAVVCCMNRNKNLLRAIPSWIETNYFDEIIVLDYGSIEPINVLENDIVKLYRYPAKFWHLTKAYNIAAQLTSFDSEIIVKLDSDYYLLPEFFQYNYLDNDKMFLTGNHCRSQPIWGFLMVHRKHFFAVNGYHERLIGWGHDDIDINNRLKAIGLKSKTIDISHIKHLPHEQDKNRYAQNNTDLNTSRIKNETMIKEQPWTTQDKMSTIDTV